MKSKISKIKKQQRDRRRKRIRAKVFGTKDIPRLAVFKSNKYVSAQLINDELGLTIAAATSKNTDGQNKKEKALAVGAAVALAAKTKKITKVVFDRGGYVYQGSVRAVADGARAAGLKF